MANEMAKVIVAENVNKVNLIVTHIRPHFDEVLAVHLLICYGNNIFPGVDEADIETWTEGKMLKEYAGKTAAQLLAEQGILCVGTCGGIFDEHGNGELTCAHLVAQYLGVADMPELQKILKFCKRVDHDGKSMPFDLHTVMKEMYEDFGDDDEGMQIVFDWAMKAIESHILGQKYFFNCADEFAKTGEIINGGPIKIATVISNSSKMHKWIRSVHSADVIIKKDKVGRMIILPTLKKTQGIIDMRDLARVIRMMEMRKRHVSSRNWKLLEVAGTIDECSCWYFYANGDQLLNGTPTCPDVEPTKLSLKDATEAVAICCAAKFDPCKKERCEKTCNKYQFGLIACRQKRFSEIEKK